MTIHIFSVFFTLFTVILIFFFFNGTSPTETYTLSLHDALPIFGEFGAAADKVINLLAVRSVDGEEIDRKSTRLNSSHVAISYAVFCLKKKKKQISHYEIKL